MHITGGSVPVRHPAHHRSPSRLSPRAYLATTGRILRQLAADRRSVAMILVVPSAVITLMYFMFHDVPDRPGAPSPFNTACLILLGLFPLFVMFLITSITMQRERASGTLERILTTPLRRLDLLAAYGSAFSIAAAAQAILACIVCFWLLGFGDEGQPDLGLPDRRHQRGARRRAGPAGECVRPHRIPGRAVHARVHRSAAAAGGHHRPRAAMPTWLEWISNAMPASYALEALQQVSAHTDLTGIAIRDIVVVLGFAVAALALRPRPCAGGRHDGGAGQTQTPGTPTRQLGQPRTHPRPRAGAVRAQRHRQDVDPRDRRGRRGGLRAGAPLLRNQRAAVRGGDRHSRRPSAVLGPIRAAPVEQLGHLIPSLLLPLWDSSWGPAWWPPSDRCWPAPMSA